MAKEELVEETTRGRNEAHGKGCQQIPSSGLLDKDVVLAYAIS